MHQCMTFPKVIISRTSVTCVTTKHSAVLGHNKYYERKNRFTSSSFFRKQCDELGKLQIHLFPSV